MVQSDSQQQPCVVSAFYKFVAVHDTAGLRSRLRTLSADCDMLGSILVAPEGINGTISGRRADSDEFFASVRSDARFADLQVKESFAAQAPFKRMKVRLKREIVSLRQPVDPTERVGTYVDPHDWNAVISDPSVLVIDTRNQEEIDVGTFANAVSPSTDAFSEFPDYVAGLDPAEHPRVAMFCTGGIRCEKATSYLLDQGFGDVMHLSGGILNYLEQVPVQDSLWTGECFVFDERVTVDHALTPGDYSLCRGCRRALSESDRQQPSYEMGVSCRHCNDALSAERRAGLRERHRQEGLAQATGLRHVARPA